MKSIFESAEVMAAYAEIDLMYYFFRDLSRKLNYMPTPSPIETIVDKATGYDKAKYKDIIQEGITILKTIIKNKKFIEADFTNDEKILEQLKKML